jgi:hypothetical protein
VGHLFHVDDQVVAGADGFGAPVQVLSPGELVGSEAGDARHGGEPKVADVPLDGVNDAGTKRQNSVPRLM